MVETRPALTNPPFNAREVREALDRGELMRLLADVEAGRITPEQLGSVMSERDRRNWVVWLTQFFLNR